MLGIARALVADPELAGAGLLDRDDEALADLTAAYEIRSAKNSNLFNHRAYARAVFNVELDEALKDVEQAIAWSGKSPNAAFIDTRGYVYFRLGRYDEALAVADEARQIFEQHGEQLLLAQLESNVGNIYYRLDRNTEALNHYERAAAIFAVQAPEQLAQVTANRANVYCNLDDFQQAQWLYQKAYDWHVLNHDHLGAVQTRYCVGYLYFLMGSYHHAMRELQEVRTECQRLGDERIAAHCIMDLAEIYLQLNILDEAALQASQARALQNEILPAAESAFEKTQLSYDEGKFDLLNVLDTQRTLFEVRLDLVNARAEYHKAKVQVEALIGHQLEGL